jgi:bifunctional DNase/RNase
MKRRADMVEMTVSQLTVDPFTNLPLLLLKDEESDDSLPIWVGLVEASSIASQLEQISLDRPTTHDLMKNLIGECGMQVSCIEIHEVRDNTFFAQVVLRAPRGRTLKRVDARPSDAIALALRAGAPIRVAREVIVQTREIDLAKQRAAVTELPDEKPAEEPAVLPLQLEDLPPAHFGKWKM